MSDPKRTVMVRGDAWTVASDKLASDTDGDCNHEDRHIRLQKGLRGKDRMWTIHHEFLHAALPDLNEDAIDSVAFSLTEALWSMGYRRRT